MLVTEFRTGKGIPVLVVAVILIIFCKTMRKDEDSEVISNPIFLMGALGYVLQFSVLRFWFDLGFPAISIWMAIEIEHMLKNKPEFFSWKRAGIACRCA